MSTQNTVHNHTNRGYVVVNFSFDANTDKVLCTANKDMVIESVNGASVSLKKGEKFYAVRSDSLGENMWYIVRFVSGEKKCSCPANKPCKHEKKVQGRVQVTKQIARAKETLAKQLATTPKAPVLTTDLGNAGHLYSNQGFCLMR